VIGEHVNEHYIVEQLLDRSDFGNFYLAYDQRADKKVGLKVIARTGPQTDTQFEADCAALSHIYSPAIPPLEGWFPYKESLVYVCDHPSGKTLEQWLTDQPEQCLKPQAAVLITLQLLDALETMHRRNPPLLHHDIRPKNIVISPDGQVHLTNFGVAGTSMVASQPAASHAVAQAFQPNDPQSDLHATGVMLRTLVSGDSSRGSNQAPKLDPALEHVISKLTAPINRYAAAREARSDLEQALQVQICINKHENPPTERFCTICGAQLPMCEPKKALVAALEPAETTNLPPRKDYKPYLIRFETAQPGTLQRASEEVPAPAVPTPTEASLRKIAEIPLVSARPASTTSQHNRGGRRWIWIVGVAVLFALLLTAWMIAQMGDRLDEEPIRPTPGATENVLVAANHSATALPSTPAPDQQQTASAEAQAQASAAALAFLVERQTSQAQVAGSATAQLAQTNRAAAQQTSAAAELQTAAAVAQTSAATQQTGEAQIATANAAATEAAIPSATAIPATRVPATRVPPSPTPQARLRFALLNYNDEPACISVSIKGITPSGWFFRTDGINLRGNFDNAGNARLCGLAAGQEVTISVFNANGAVVRGGGGIPAKGSAILIAEWR
jgi:serine/threonine protein kinase